MGNLSGITDGGWNADEEAKKGGFDPIPAGDYLVVVIKMTWGAYQQCVDANIQESGVAAMNKDE
jgi:hypothetical protein